VADGREEVRDARAVPAQLRDLLHHGAVLARQRRGLGPRVVRVGHLVGAHAQAGLADDGGAELRAVHGLHGDAARAVRQVDLAHDLGDRAVRGEAAVDARHEQDAALHGPLERLGLLARGHGEGDAGAREHHGVVEWEDRQNGGVPIHRSSWRSSGYPT
jgi:hypothetical protein